MCYGKDLGIKAAAAADEVWPMEGAVPPCVFFTWLLNNLWMPQPNTQLFHAFAKHLRSMHKYYTKYVLVRCQYWVLVSATGANRVHSMYLNREGKKKGCIFWTNRNIMSSLYVLYFAIDLAMLLSFDCRTKWPITVRSRIGLINYWPPFTSANDRDSSCNENV